MNEIDFTLAPSDVSLSRCYQMSKDNSNTNINGGGLVGGGGDDEASNKSPTETIASQSLTRALNTASNRAVRRILLSRSWPSAEALNLSLRAMIMAEQEAQEQTKAGLVQGGGDDGEGSMKCPVPRPILNILTNKNSNKDPSSSTSSTTSSTTTEEREQQWIQNQLTSFRQSYSSISGYEQAEAYLESILDLATCGIESKRVTEFMNNSDNNNSVYAEPYQRILSVIQSVGAVLKEVDDEEDGGRRRMKISKKLLDQDFCLSMLDKLSLVNERKKKQQAVAASTSGSDDDGEEGMNPLAIPYDAAAQLAYEEDGSSSSSMTFDEFKEKYVADTVAMVMAKKEQRDSDGAVRSSESNVQKNESNKPTTRGRKRRLAFWRKSDNDDEKASSVDTTVANTNSDDDVESSTSSSSPPADPIVIDPDDLGGVLLSAEEPTMTRQLNVLSNIVQRTLIFGGDQELLLLAKTLDADKPAFIQRWYKGDDNSSFTTDIDFQEETRPGVQYLNSLIQLLNDCYTKGVLNDVTPTLPLTTGYENAYGRLTALLIELGSGYIRPSSSSPLSLSYAGATAKYLKSTTPPKSAREEFGRFANWESAVRKNSENPYPDE